MKISVVTPSIRREGLDIVHKCLRRQDFVDFEWIVVSPFQYDKADLWLEDPPKREGDFWNLCKAWNKAYAHAEGDLVVNIQDLVWFPPNTLSAFWSHYAASPKALVTAVGDHYDQLDDRGVPTNVVWQDPRKRSDQGTFYRIEPPDMEMTMCSVPKQALWDCGGIDEDYDKGPGVQEKEMCFRLRVLGYEMWIDQTIEYKAVKHPRLTEDWDEKYWSVTAPMFKRHMAEMMQAQRPLNVHALEVYNKAV